MRSFKVPFKKDYSDKIIGGWLTIRQLVYLVIPVIVIAIAIANYSLFTYKVGKYQELNWTLIIVASVIWIALLIACVLIAFFEVNHLTLDKYLVKKMAFATKKKHIKFYE